jgi:hypothetical protein
MDIYFCPFFIFANTFGLEEIQENRYYSQSNLKNLRLKLNKEYYEISVCWVRIVLNTHCINLEITLLNTPLGLYIKQFFLFIIYDGSSI